MKKVLALAMALALAFSLAGCSGTTSGSSLASSEMQEESSQSASAADSTSETPTLDAIREKGVLTMLTATGYPPYEYIGDDGEPAGVDIDLAQMVADDLDVELEVIDMNFTLVIDSLKSGKGDFIAAGMTATEERSTQVDFTINYGANDLKLVVPVENDTIQGLEDLSGLTLAMQEGTTAHIYAEENVPDAEILAFNTPIEAADAVASGKADAAIIDNLPAKAITQSNEKLKQIEEPLTHEGVSMAVNKGQEDLLEEINKVLQQAQDSGKLDELFGYHFEVAGG
ncbi:MAG: ABC transporter substrate-binding protein [Pygmaiobacter massiliensis]|nr:ABC transporter substrate-binding protein [Pygmaiobacter massiliensis]